MGESKFINCLQNVITCLSINISKFTSWIFGKLFTNTQTKLFYWIFAQKIIITANFLSCNIESDKALVHISRPRTVKGYVIICIYLTLSMYSIEILYRNMGFNHQKQPITYKCTLQNLATNTVTHIKSLFYTGFWFIQGSV